VVDSIYIVCLESISTQPEVAERVTGVRESPVQYSTVYIGGWFINSDARWGGRWFVLMGFESTRGFQLSSSLWNAQVMRVYATKQPPVRE
jgi:hypothetical protein